MNLFITKKLGNKEYKVFLPFVWFSVIVLLSIAFIGLNENNWSLEPNYYSVCNIKAGCPNEYFNSVSCIGSVYESTPLCTKAFLFYGESIGTKPSWVTANSVLIIIIIVSLFLLGNTLLFNKSFLKDVKLEDFKNE